MQVKCEKCNERTSHIQCGQVARKSGNWVVPLRCTACHRVIEVDADSDIDQSLKDWYAGGTYGC